MWANLLLGSVNVKPQPTTLHGDVFSLIVLGRLSYNRSPISKKSYILVICFMCKKLCQIFKSGTAEFAMGFPG